MRSAHFVANISHKSKLMF